MSFRRRLTVTVLLIVVVPVVAIAIILVPLSSESRTGKTDARLAGALELIQNDYDAELDAARRAARQAAADPALGSAVQSGPGPELDAAVSDLVRELDLAGLEVRRGDTVLGRFARGGPIASVELRVSDAGSAPGTLLVSTIDAAEFADRVDRATDLPFAISVDGTTLSSDGPEGFALELESDLESDLEGEGSSTEDVSVAGDDYRARVVSLPSAAGGVRAALLSERDSGVLSSGQTLIAVILAALILLAFVLIVPLLRDLRQVHERTAEEAITDELTGLSNHRRFRQILGKEVERAKRFDRPLSVVLLDLDDFKDINDTHGHLQGDRVLREVGRILAAESREVDEPARYGGEEFAIALPETGIDGAVEVGERIRRRLDRTRIPLDGNEGEITIRASVGVAGSPEQPPHVRTLIEAADQALYQAKRGGKNRTARAARGWAAEAIAQ